MADMQIAQARLLGGVWEARLTGPETEPRLSVTHLGEPIDGLTVTPDGDRAWHLRIPIPAAAVSDGVQTFLVTDTAGGQTLARFTLVAGEPLAEDLRAEIALLRAELDMLKQAFRRHAAQG